MSLAKERAQREKAEAIELLAVNEDATAELYSVYAKLFPAARPFWLHLVGEEKLHALWVRQFAARMQRGEVDFQADRFSPSIYQDFLDYLHRRLTEARQQPLSLFEALSIARDLEDTMIEQVFFQVLEGDDPALQQMLRNLHHSTEAHRERVNERWTAERQLQHPEKKHETTGA